MALDRHRPRPSPEPHAMHDLRPGRQRVALLDSVAPDARLLQLQVDLLDPALPTGPELGSLGDDRVDDLPRRAVTLDRPFDAPRARLDVRGGRCAFALLALTHTIVPGTRC